jgi:hypothetical protein
MTHEERQRATQRLNQPRASRADKDVAKERVAGHIPRDVEDVEMERIDPNEEDSGEIEPSQMVPYPSPSRKRNW